MKSKWTAIILFLVLAACQKETISTGTAVSDNFYLDIKGASMRVLVEGNVDSHIFLIIVHGGPGSSALPYNTDYISSHLENDFAVVYPDQRNAGSSQGNINGKYLNMTQMTEDLHQLIQVIKSRYGNESQIFLLGHSFGAMLTTSYLTTYYIQGMVDGWIVADGSFDYPLNDVMTRQALIVAAGNQIRWNNHVKEWKEIVDWCNLHTGSLTLEESLQLEEFAADAETYIPEVKQPDPVADYTRLAIRNKWPLSSMLVNYLSTSKSDFLADLYLTSYTARLNKIKIPTLILYGKYDFICPYQMGMYLINLIRTSDNKLVISPVSGHNIMFQDPELFCREVSGFIESHRRTH